MPERRDPKDSARVAVVQKRGRFSVAEPLFEPGSQFSLGGGPKVKPGRMALVEPGRGRGRARVLRPLGNPSRARDVIEALLHDRGLRRGFSSKLEAQARDAAANARDQAGERRDLTELATFTVDPATARDFDDAVSARAEGDGVRLWIHIADVAAHVTPGGALEAEAYRRANSTYIPGAVEPMLPDALSSEACSLVPGEERLAVTTEIELSGSGEPDRARFYRSRIRSDARFSYAQIDDFFVGRKRPPGAVAEPLGLTRRAAAALADRRRAGLEVQSTEPEFDFEGGHVIRARDVAQTEAHRLIEMLMILTNEQVAQLLERKKVPTLYRVHEQPDPEAIEALFAKLAALEVPTPPMPDRLSPKQASRLAVEASRMVIAEAKRRGHGREAYTSLVLRSMKQAHYSDRNLGHAGLGSPAYCHFTSPIRRYPDLVCHRGLLSVTGEGETPPRARGLAEAGAHCSERERDAMKLERRADDVCAAFLLEQRELREAGPGARFEGEVSGLVGAGAFVRFGGELASVYEGFLPARNIGGRERYELDATETALVGSRQGRRVRLGDPVTVTVDRVEAPRGRVDLLPVESPGGGTDR